LKRAKTNCIAFAAAFLLSATMALAQPQATAQPSTQNAPTQYPDAPSVQISHANANATKTAQAKSPRAKSQAEFDAYKAAAMLTDPSKLEAAATDFAQKFPASELRYVLFQQAMGLYQQAGNPGKTLELARAVLKFEPGNAVALLTAAQLLAERTQDNDLDRDDRLAEAKADAGNALQNAGDVALPTNMTPEQFAAALAELRATAHEVLGTVAFKKQDYASAVREYTLTAEEAQEHADAVIWVRLSLALDRSGDYAKAAAAAQKAIAAAEPGSPVRQLAEQEQARLEKLTPAAAKSGGK
jgi:hypothetical protein